MRIRCIALVAMAAATSGCNLLPDAYTSCAKPQPYQAAEETAPLKVPSGSDLPDTKNALRIPAVKAPERPREGDACIDHPPSYGSQRPVAKPADG